VKELKAFPAPAGWLSPGGVFAKDHPGFRLEETREERSSRAETAADEPVSLVVLKKFLISVT